VDNLTPELRLCRICGGAAFLRGAKWATPMWAAPASLMSHDHSVDAGPMICLA
jgi:hypothetical protein